MRRYLAALALAALAGRGAAFAEPAPAKTPTRPKSHGYSLAGVVMRVDVAAKTFVVRANTGVETTLVRTSATHVPGELLRPGDKVAVRYLERDGKKIATSVRIESATVAGLTPTAPAGAR